MGIVIFAAIVAVVLTLLYFTFGIGSSPPEVEEQEDEEKTTHDWHLLMRFTTGQHNLYECYNCAKLYELNAWDPFDDESNMESVYRQNEKEPYCK